MTVPLVASGLSVKTNAPLPTVRIPPAPGPVTETLPVVASTRPEWSTTPLTVLLAATARLPVSTSRILSVELTVVAKVE